jgi:hypothetical protein
MKLIASGWKKDPYDTRDYLHLPCLKKYQIPEKQDLTEDLAGIWDQGQVGSCVGHGVSLSITSTAIQKSISLDERFSPTWYYNGARFIEGTLAFDAGCFPRDAYEWALKNGHLFEKFWPYNSRKFDPNSPVSKANNANKLVDFQYFRVDDSIEGITSALADGHFVTIGCPWPNKWMDIDYQGILPEVNADDFQQSGHETCLVGYDLTTNYFIGANSWGDSWGKNGFYYMPMATIEIFKQVGGYDCHYVVFSNLAPPVPQVSKCNFFKLLYEARNKKQNQFCPAT